MADRHDSDGRESPESPRTGRPGEPGGGAPGVNPTERDDTHSSAENEHPSALDLDEDPAVDLAQIRADDALLDAIAARFADADDTAGDRANGATLRSGAVPATALDGDADLDDERLNALLLAWREDVESVPVPDIVDTPTAVATVTAARSARRHRSRLLVPVAAAAAVLAVAFAGVGMAARDAEPGDALWALSKVLYADHARSVEAAHSVRTDLNDAQNALEQGRIDEAKSALDEAGTELSLVSTEDGKADLQAEHNSLLNQLDAPGVAPRTPAPAQRSETVKPASSASVTTPTPSVKPSSTPASTSSAQSSSSVTPSTEPSGDVETPRSDVPTPGSGMPTGASGASVKSEPGSTTPSG